MTGPIIYLLYQLAWHRLNDFTCETKTMSHIEINLASHQSNVFFVFIGFVYIPGMDLPSGYSAGVSKM